MLGSATTAAVTTLNLPASKPCPRNKGKSNVDLLKIVKAAADASERASNVVAVVASQALSNPDEQACSVCSK